MPIGSDPLDELVIPDATTAEEHDLVTAGDILIGGQSDVEFGVRGRNVLAGERVEFDGGIEAEGDCRLDMWCDVAGSVLVGEDAYLGERVHIGGQLMVSGDLDIGDDVEIDEGFEANGWIVIRNPMPTIVFLFIYLSQLLRLGEEDVAQELVAEAFDDEPGAAEPLVVPRGSRVSDDVWRVSTPARIGAECRLHGNIRADEVTVGRDTELFGSVRARGDITIAEGTTIHGDVTTRGGDVRIEADVRIRGDISSGTLELHDGAEVDGTIRTSDEMTLITDEPDDTDETAEADEGADVDAPAGTADAARPAASESDATEGVAVAGAGADTGADGAPEADTDE